MEAGTIQSLVGIILSRVLDLGFRLPVCQIFFEATSEFIHEFYSATGEMSAALYSTP